MEAIRYAIELAAQGIELFAITVIVVAIVHATIRYLVRVQQQQKDVRIIRTFLSWSLVVEIEGRWPWREHEAE